MACVDCGEPCHGRRCKPCSLTNRYDGRGFAPSDTDYAVVFVRVSGLRDEPHIYHTERDCSGLQHAAIRQRAKRFLPDDCRECHHCAGTVAKTHNTPDHSYQEALREAAGGGD